jgi:PhzF family phenazine biosynthesis protein
VSRRIRLVDVFGERPLTGNPLAVVVDAEDLSSDEMQELTRWINFSETAFLLPPTTEEADYRVRIFTLAGELPFAGHPTLGSCHVWRSSSDAEGEEFVQECGAGLVRLRVSGQRVSFEAPPLVRSGPVDPVCLANLAYVLGVSETDIVAAAWVDNGPGWVGVVLEDASTVLDLNPDFGRSQTVDEMYIGVVGMHPEGWEHLYELRAFFPGEHGETLEDPVTGSLNASMAQWFLAEGRARAPYVASQGTALGRMGRIHISGDAGSVWVGGRVFDVVEGLIPETGQT